MFWNTTDRLLDKLKNGYRTKSWSTEEAKKVIVALGSKKNDPRVVAALKQKLSDVNCRECIRTSLMRIGGPEAAKVLVDHADKVVDPERRAFAEAAITAGYEPTSAEDRLRLVLAVGDYGAVALEGGIEPLLVELRNLLKLRGRYGDESNACIEARLIGLLRALSTRPSAAITDALVRNLYTVLGYPDRTFADALARIDPSRLVLELAAHSRKELQKTEAEALMKTLEQTLLDESSRISDEALNVVMGLQDVTTEDMKESDFGHWYPTDRRVHSFGRAKGLASEALRGRTPR